MLIYLYLAYHIITAKAQQDALFLRIYETLPHLLSSHHHEVDGQRADENGVGEHKQGALRREMSGVSSE